MGARFQPTQTCSHLIQPKHLLLANIHKTLLHQLNITQGMAHQPADSHLGFVDITNTYKDIELLPFKELIKSNNADMVMVAHVVNTNIDPTYPASLSPIFINTKLRGELGYNGVVITDDLDMGAITQNYSFDDKIVRAINAGNDILILSNNIKTYDKDIVIKARNTIDQALQNGTISWDQIIASYNRIQALKAKYKII
jgi:beta-N-acetylhexosaminidase